MNTTHKLRNNFIARRLPIDKITASLTGRVENLRKLANLGMIIDNPQVLRKVVDEHRVPQGHQNSEDIIHDPEVVEWIDRYAERLKDLTDPVWLELIEDPNYRWCKHGKEYQELFRYSDRGRLYEEAANSWADST